jgi:hypothetical protein
VREKRERECSRQKEIEREKMLPNYQQFIEYCIAFLPIAYAHLTIPPREYFRGERVLDERYRPFFEILYSSFFGPDVRLQKDFVDSMMFDTSIRLELRLELRSEIIMVERKREQLSTPQP